MTGKRFSIAKVADRPETRVPFHEVLSSSTKADVRARLEELTDLCEIEIAMGGEAPVEPLTPTVAAGVDRGPVRLLLDEGARETLALAARSIGESSASFAKLVAVDAAERLLDGKALPAVLKVRAAEAQAQLDAVPIVGDTVASMHGAVTVSTLPPPPSSGIEADPEKATARKKRRYRKAA